MKHNHSEREKQHDVNSSLADVASPFECNDGCDPFIVRGKQDSYQHQTHSRMSTMIWSRGGALPRKENMNSVHSPLRCVRSPLQKKQNKHDDIIPETRTEGSKRMGTDNDDGK